MIRFFLDTDLFKELVNQSGYEFIVVHNLGSIRRFIEQYKNVTEIGYPKKTGIKVVNRLLRLAVNKPSVTRRYFSTGYIGFRNIFLGAQSAGVRIKRILKLFITLFISIIPYEGKKLFRDAFIDGYFEHFLKEHRINGIILTCPVIEEERILACEANKLGIPIIMGTDGWDVLTNFGFPHRYEGVLVWGPEMARHAKVMRFKENQIISTGIPYIEKLRTFYRSADKTHIRKKYGIQSDNKIILIWGNVFYASGEVEKRTVEHLLGLIEKDVLGNVRIIYRFVPREYESDEERYYKKKYGNNKGIIFQKPISNRYGSEFFKEEAEIFAISDVIVGILSMGLLEASLVNIPAIICNYSDIYYPTRYVERSPVYNSLINCGLFEVRSFLELKENLYNILNNKLAKKRDQVYKQWNYVDPGYLRKIFSLLN